MRAMSPSTATVLAFAPGRVNLIGEHTDYNQGLALPFAIDRGVSVHAHSIAARCVRANAIDMHEQDEFALSAIDRADGWRAYVRGITAELQSAGVTLGGTSLEISGDVPQGSGLSSSAALQVALALALSAVAGEVVPDRVELAELCSRVENEWAGAQTGLLDQLASLCGEEGSALRIDFRSLEVETVPLALAGHRLVTLDSGEEHSNAGPGYNRRRTECAQACKQLGIQSLRDATADMVDDLPEPLRRRARHVLEENKRVEQTVAALKAGDVDRVGELLDASHTSLRDLYEVSTDAVEAAVERLREAGAIGARVVGGGFGGNVLGLLPEDAGLLPGPWRCDRVRARACGHHESGGGIGGDRDSWALRRRGRGGGAGWRGRAPGVASTRGHAGQR